MGRLISQLLDFKTTCFNIAWSSLDIQGLHATFVYLIPTIEFVILTELTMTSKIVAERVQLEKNAYSWIGHPIRADKKIIPEKTVGATTIPRPLLKSSWLRESISDLTILVKSIFNLLFLETSENMVSTKIVKEDLDLPSRIIVWRGLRPF